MLPYSKLPLLAFLALLCAAVSGCISTSVLSSDPKTAEDILQLSTEHQGRVALMNGDTISCYAVSVRQDSTFWGWTKFGRKVAVPTDNVATIEADGTGILLDRFPGSLVGSVAGAFLGSVIGALSGNPVGFLLIGFLFGNTTGKIVGENHRQLWKQGGKVGQMGDLKWDAKHEQWIFVSSDTLHTPDTTQSKLLH
jgi:hypothetical protein